MTIEELLQKLRTIEASVPSDIRDDWNFYGLRIDETGTSVSIAKRDQTNIDQRLEEVPAFKEAKAKMCLQRGAVDPAKKSLLSISSASKEAGACESVPCLAGDPCYAVDHSGRDLFESDAIQFGTLGWFFYLDGMLVGLSNYHVFCKKGDATPPGSTRIYKCLDTDEVRNNYDIGGLHAFHLCDVPNALYDMALVRIADESYISGAFTPKEGSQPRYPKALGASNLIGAGERYYLIGAGSSKKITMGFAGVGSRRSSGVPGMKWLYEQLFFDPTNDLGDSGAVVVHESSNTVVALNHTCEAKFTIASPLYRKPWKLLGTRKLPDGTEIPAFATSCQRLRVERRRQAQGA